MKPIEENKDKIISIRLSSELYENLMKHKKANKINISFFIRGVIADRLEYLKRKKK
jgi:predicted DNA-binding protein